MFVINNVHNYYNRLSARRSTRWLKAHRTKCCDSGLATTTAGIATEGHAEALETFQPLIKGQTAVYVPLFRCTLSFLQVTADSTSSFKENFITTFRFILMVPFLPAILTGDVKTGPRHVYRLI